MMFVRRIAELLGWPPGAVPNSLNRVDVEGGERQDHSTRHMAQLWVKLLESSLDDCEPEAVDWAADGQRAATDAVVECTEEIRLALRKAIALACCARLTYRTAHRGVRTERIVEPHAIHAFHGYEYLHAYCRWRQDIRVFRIDRIERCTVLEERFGLP